MTATLSKENVIGRPDRPDRREAQGGRRCALPVRLRPSRPGARRTGLIDDRGGPDHPDRPEPGRGGAGCAGGAHLRQRADADRIHRRTISADDATAAEGRPDSPLWTTHRHRRGHHPGAGAGRRATRRGRVRGRSEPVLDIDDPRANVEDNPFDLESSRGDVPSALDAADVTVDAHLHDRRRGEQPDGPVRHRRELAGRPAGGARHHPGPVVGAARARGHVRGAGRERPGADPLPRRRFRRRPAAVEPHRADHAGRPGGRPPGQARAQPAADVPLGRPPRRQPATDAAGRDAATADWSRSTTTPSPPAAIGDHLPSPLVMGTPAAYACDNVQTHERRAHLNIPYTGFMRAPGTIEEHYALESALDELADRLGMDPVELRLRNYAEVHPVSGKPWSSKALRECLRVGAERFGWSGRDPAPRSTRDGDVPRRPGHGLGDLRVLRPALHGHAGRRSRRQRGRALRGDRHRHRHLYDHRPDRRRAARHGRRPGPGRDR